MYHVEIVGVVQRKRMKMAKLIKKEIIKMKSEIKSFELFFVSGEKRKINIEGNIFKNYWVEEGCNQNPFYIRSPEESIEKFIEKKWAFKGVNFAHVESYNEFKSEDIEFRVAKETYKKWLFGEYFKFYLMEK